MRILLSLHTLELENKNVFYSDITYQLATYLLSFSFLDSFFVKCGINLVLRFVRSTFRHHARPGRGPVSERRPGNGGADDDAARTDVAGSVHRCVSAARRQRGTAAAPRVCRVTLDDRRLHRSPPSFLGRWRLELLLISGLARSSYEQLAPSTTVLTGRARPACRPVPPHPEPFIFSFIVYGSHCPSQSVSACALVVLDVQSSVALPRAPSIS